MVLKRVKKLIPLSIKSHIRNYLKTVKIFGFFFKPKLAFLIFKTRNVEDLLKFRLLEPKWAWMLRGLSLNENVPFLNDTKFLKSYDKGVGGQISQVFQKSDDLIIWRAHPVTWFLSQALPSSGDFVECGVWYGWLSKTIIEYLDFEKQDRTFYLIDGWNSNSQGINPGSYFDPLSKNVPLKDFVQQRFNYRNVELIQGWIPEVFEKVDFPQIEKVAYLSIDMNGYLAEIASLEYFYPRMVQGGIIYLDDYGHGYPGLVDAVDSFFRDKPEKLLYFPSGIVIIVKQ